MFVDNLLKTKKEYRILKKQENELDKGCFQHDMDYGDFKDLNRRTAADKVILDEALDIAKNRKHDGY